MKHNKEIKFILGVMIATLVLFSILGFTYAYFTLEIEGKPKDIVMNTGDLRLEYRDETELKLTDAVPGDSISKVITVTNVGNKAATYSLYWGDLINTIENYELHVSLDCKSYSDYSNKTISGTCNNIYRAVPISDTVTDGYIKKNISIDAGVTQEYTVTIKFDNKPYPQDDNINKTFTGKIGIEAYQAPEAVYCTFDGELTQGAEYVNGQYTYRYKQEGSYSSSSELVWNNISEDGWGVQLTKKTSTDAVTSKVCTYINNKPVVSMSNMFFNSQAISLDLSDFNTSEVTDMSLMFAWSKATILDLSSFDTSNVENMDNMFRMSHVATIDVSSFDTRSVTNMCGMFESTVPKKIDLSSFNTSTVTDMSRMFYSSQATTLDLNSFDTSNVTNMSEMFSGSQATTLDVSNFDTSKVTNMSLMFSNSEATTLDVSNFDTSKVTDMHSMFSSSKATTLDLSSFDTSKVTNMGSMFYASKATTLDLSSFDTSKVIHMGGMFESSKATTLDLSNFDTSNVTIMSGMFESSEATTLDLSNFDTSNVIIMSYMFYKSQATTLDLSSFDTSKVTDMRKMFNNCLNLKTIYVSNKFSITNVTSSTDMFSSSTNLVGGAGTVYDANNVDKTYARIDGGTSSPGYFTLKN